jgi:predicted transcriptional regulator
MTSSNAPEMQIVQSLLDALQALPGAHAELRFIEGPSTPSGYRPDAEISLEMGGRQYALRVEAKRELFPRDAREVLWRMDRSTSTNDGSAILRMVAADSLSPGAKDLLKAEGVGYFDRGGSLYLPAPGAYVYIDKPPPKSITKAIGSLFTGRRAQVIHALLLHPRDWLTGKELAERAQASPATVSQVMTELERLEFIAESDQGVHKGRQLQEPGRLLDQWAEYVKALKPPVFHRYFLPSLRAEQLLEAVTRVFAANEVAYAVSFEAAAQAYAPFLSSLSQVKCRAMSGSALEAGLAALNARVVEEGANFSVLETESAGDLLFREQHHGTWLASPIQVYLDLLRSEGRARELAQNLRRERISL